MMIDDPGVVTRGTLLGNIPGCTELGFPFPELGLGIPIAVSDLHLYTVTHFSFPMPGVISGREFNWSVSDGVLILEDSEERYEDG